MQRKIRMEKLENILQEALELYETEYADEDVDETFKSIRTFKEAGLLTNDDGLVIETKDNRKYQVSIVEV